MLEKGNDVTMQASVVPSLMGNKPLKVFTVLLRRNRHTCSRSPSRSVHRRRRGRSRSYSRSGSGNKSISPLRRKARSSRSRSYSLSPRRRSRSRSPTPWRVRKCVNCCKCTGLSVPVFENTVGYFGSSFGDIQPV